MDSKFTELPSTAQPTILKSVNTAVA